LAERKIIARETRGVSFVFEVFRVFIRAIPENNEKKGGEAGDCRTRRRTQAG